MPQFPGDSASAAQPTPLVRNHCSHDEPPTSPYFGIGTLAVTELSRSSAIERAWNEAVRQDVFSLPEDVATLLATKGRMPVTKDGFSHFIEVRRGREYHASFMGELGNPRIDAERRAKAIVEALYGLR